VDLLLNKIPGNNAGEQLRNLTYLYLFGKHLADVEVVSTDEIRDLFREYRGADRNRNLMRSLRSDKRNLRVQKQSRKKFTVKLTRPGLDHAKELIQSLEQN
jgi:phage-related minor tail protein